MLKNLLFTLILSIFVAACASQPTIDVPVESDLDKVQDQIIQLEQRLADEFTLSCSDNIVDLDAKIEELKQAKETTKIVERCSSPVKSTEPVTLDGKLLIGEIETVKLILNKEPISFSARIDSGAVTSSIGIFNQKNFERDGDSWVRFSLSDDDEAVVHEYPIYDTVSIKQTKDLNEERVEIKTDIEVNGKVYKNQIFNLADRTYLEHQLLIGRSFLRDIAVIDVGSKFLLDGE